MLLRRYILLAFVCLCALAASAGLSADTLTVYFSQGNTAIDMTYMGNDTTAAKIREILNNQNNSPLSSVIIQGAASPEGSTSINERLARGRALAIARYFNIPDTLVATSSTAQDWEGLHRRVKNDPNVPYKEEVEQVVSDIVSCANKACPIDVLRNMHNRRPYQYLYANHFPYLRRSQIILVGTHGSCVRVSGASADTVCVASADTISVSSLEIKSEPIIDVVEVIADSPQNRTHEPCVPTIFGLKTNLLYDAALIPNIGIEFPIGSHFSVGANWMYAWWKNHARNRHWRLYGGDVTARYWFKDGARSLNGHHVGIYGTVLLYQVAFGGKGYISGIPGQNMTGGKPWIGGGVEYGYSLNVHPRLNIDFSLGVGYTSGEQRVYRMIDDCYVWQSSHRKQWFGPTKAEISLVWKIGSLPQARKEGTR